MAVNDRLVSQKNKNGLQAVDEMQLKKQDFPWWMVAIGLVILATFLLIQINPDFKDAFNIIRAGLGVTISTTIIAYCIAILVGLLVGLGRVSGSLFWRNMATIYVEIIRGIPLLVLIFFIALVLIPGLITLLNVLGAVFIDVGLQGIGEKLVVIESRSIPNNVRAIISLAITYGAFSAEIFRAGIQSINKGQMEAARSQGMSHWQAMRCVILPQAIRNVLPALGNDLISMLKDSSLVSILAVRDITQIARLYAGHSFKFAQAYSILCVLYLTLTLVLSLIMKMIERKLGNDRK
ncbi:MAG: amino acid ABC transporter permease [Anaerolineaceae bacterium]|nr:MAG: amino acid ABC transporter permease [Anaerolineaceae bacterium]